MKFRFLFYTIIISLQGLAQTVDTASSKDSRQMEEVVVTGQFSPQSIKNSVYKVKTISQATIKMRAAVDLAGVLNNELGFRFSNDFTLGESDISIMGMNGNNVKILLDGIPMVDRGSTKQSLSQIDINSVERVEIVEGPMSVIYGSDALAGVINVITKKTAHKDQLSVFARMQEETVGNTYEPFTGQGIHHEHLSVNWSKKGWNAMAYGTRNNFGGWKGDAESRMEEMKPKDQWLTGLSAGYTRKGFNLLYRLDYLNEDIFVAGKYNQNNTALDANYITNRFTHQLQAEWQAGSNLQLNTAISYQDYKRQTETYLLDFTTGTKSPSANAGEWDQAIFKSGFFRTTANWRVHKKISFQPGFEFKSDKAGGERIADNPVINDASFFVSAEYQPIEGLIIRPGLRSSYNSVYDAPPIIPSLNVKLKLNDQFDVRAAYARGFRAPALRELYFYFYDANHSIEGNPDLKAEYSNSFNAALSWKSSTSGKQQMSSILSGFYNDFRNRISLAQGNNNVFTYLNISRYKTAGFTLENKIQIKRVTASLGFSYIARYNEYFGDSSYKSGNDEKFAWSPEINSSLSYHLVKFKTDVSFFYKYTGKLPQYRIGVDAVNMQPAVYLSNTAAYHWADITSTTNLFAGFNFQAGIKNLFDVKRLQNTAADAGSAHNSGGPVLMAYGRSFFAGISYQWNRTK